MVLPRVRRNLLLCVLLLGHTLFSTVPPLYGVKLSAIQSCAGTCGEARELPCSCDMKCPVYKNCCEDFFDECPHVLKASREVYRKQMLANVECVNSAFTITNCVDEIEETDPTTRTSQNNNVSTESSRAPVCCSEHMGSTNSSPHTQPEARTGIEEKGSTYTKTNNIYTGNEEKDYVTTKTNISTGNEEKGSPNTTTRLDTGKGEEDWTYTDPKLIDVIQSAQVTDTETGFVYLNMHVFRCFASNTSSPVIWDTQFEMLNMKSSTSLNAFARQIYSLISPRYTQPSRADGGINEALCIDNISASMHYVDSCESQDAQAPVNPKWSERCQEFSSYVSVINWGFWYFKNRYCALCRFGPDKLMKPVTVSPISRHDYDFPVVVSLLNEKIRLSDVFWINALSWTEIVCNITPSLEQMEVNGCAATSCKEGFVKRPTGTCNKVFKVHFAFHGDEFALDSTQLHHYPSFFLCHLKRVFDLVSNDEYQPFVLRDVKENRLLYGLTFQFYSPESIDLDWTGPYNYLKQLEKAVKLFKYYRQQQSVRSHNASTEHELKLALTQRLGVKSFYYYDLKTQHNFSDQDKQTSGDMNVSSCLCTSQGCVETCSFGCIYGHFNTSDTSLSDDLCLGEYKTRLQKAASDAVLVTSWFMWSSLSSISLCLVL